MQCLRGIWTGAAERLLSNLLPFKCFCFHTRNILFVDMELNVFSARGCQENRDAKLNAMNKTILCIYIENASRSISKRLVEREQMPTTIFFHDDHFPLSNKIESTTESSKNYTDHFTSK